jgi:hypothetical protein
VDNGAFFVGVAPSAADRFLVFGAGANQDPALARFSTPANFFEGTQNTTAVLGGTGWSHSFDDRNVLTAAVFGLSGLDRRYTNAASGNLPGFIVGGTSTERNRTEGVSAALSHMIGFGDLTLHYGFEAQRGRSIARTAGRSYVYNIANASIDIADLNERTDTRFEGTRLYADAFWRPFDWLERRRASSAAPLRSKIVLMMTLFRHAWASAFRPSRDSGCGRPIARMSFSPSPSPWLR